MMETSAAFSVEKSQGYRAILTGGLLAGVLDIVAACVNSGLRGVTPIRVLQSIAAGLLGADAYKGGTATAALGLVLHFFIATVAAAVFYAASRKLKWMTERAIPSGLAYGVAVYLFMSQIVVPLSAAPFKVSRTPGSVATSLAIHMLFVGLPISLAVRRYSK